MSGKRHHALDSTTECHDAHASSWCQSYIASKEKRKEKPRRQRKLSLHQLRKLDTLAQKSRKFPRQSRNKKRLCKFLWWPRRFEVDTESTDRNAPRSPLPQYAVEAV
eukprot:400036-Pelagomonas_calceolata.AAC.1